MVILVILHQHSLAGSIMGLLDLDWYSRLLGVKFALLSHSDLGLPGFHAVLYSAEEVRWLSSRYNTNTIWLGPHHWITRPRLAHHGCWESNFTLLSHSNLLLWTARLFCVIYLSLCFMFCWRLYM